MQNAGHGIDKRTLAVTTWTMEEEHSVLCGIAGEAITCNAPEICYEFAVTARSLFEESSPDWSWRSRGGWRHGGFLGDEIARRCWSDYAARQIDGASWRSQ